MTFYPLLRRSVAALKPLYNGRLNADRKLRTSTINWSKNPSDPGTFREFTSLSGAESVVNYDQLKAMLAKRSVQLFDVRNADEYKAGHIPTAVNIPLGELQESLKLPPEQFRRRFKVQIPKKEDDNIVFHCQRGRRSITALEIAWGLGFSRARHYPGAYSEWAEKEKQ